MICSQAVSWALIQAGLQTADSTAALVARVTQCAAAQHNSGNSSSGGGGGSAPQQASRVAQLSASLVAAAAAGRVPEQPLHSLLLAAAAAALPDMDACQLGATAGALASLGVLDVPTLSAYEQVSGRQSLQASSTLGDWTELQSSPDYFSLIG